MTDDQQAIRDRILVAALAHVAFDGWTRRTLKAGVKDAGMSPDMALRAFAGGIPDLVDHWADWADRRMLDDLAAQDLAAMRIRDRITAAVKARLQVMDPHPEAARRLFAYLALPPNAPLATTPAISTITPSVAFWHPSTRPRPFAGLPTLRTATPIPGPTWTGASPMS